VWWHNLNIDPLPIALQLWRRSGAMRTDTAVQATSETRKGTSAPEAMPDPAIAVTHDDGRAGQ
jgi:hypothetical protein